MAGFYRLRLELGPAALIAEALLGGLLQTLERALGADGTRTNADDAHVEIGLTPPSALVSDINAELAIEPAAKL